jgi:hypothetical protein
MTNAHAAFTASPVFPTSMQPNLTAPVTPRALTDRLRLGWPYRYLDLTAGHLVVLEPGLTPHVEAGEESAFLLNIGGPSRVGHQAVGAAVDSQP